MEDNSALRNERFCLKLTVLIENMWLPSNNQPKPSSHFQISHSVHTFKFPTQWLTTHCYFCSISRWDITETFECITSKRFYRSLTRLLEVWAKLVFAWMVTHCTICYYTNLRQSLRQLFIKISYNSLNYCDITGFSPIKVFKIWLVNKIADVWQ